MALKNTGIKNKLRKLSTEEEGKTKKKDLQNLYPKYYNSRNIPETFCQKKFTLS